MKKSIFIIFPVSQILMLVGDYMASGKLDTFASIGVIASIIADVIILFALIHGEKKEKIEKDLEKVKYLNEIEHEKNEIMERNQKKLYEMRSDFERRMQEINENMEQGNIEEKNRKLEELQEKLESTRPNIYCKHTVTNAVLNEKEKKCKELGFSIDMDVLIPNEIKMAPLHMCSIFSNQLDNAIEAVSELAAENRQIKLSAIVKDKYLVIKVINPATKEYATQKRRNDRGYGTLILKDIAEKYEGEYTGAFENGYYSAVLGVKIA